MGDLLVGTVDAANLVGEQISVVAHNSRVGANISLE